jgi:hypothetical protein
MVANLMQIVAVCGKYPLYRPVPGSTGWQLVANLMRMVANLMRMVANLMQIVAVDCQRVEDVGVHHQHPKDGD